MPPAVDGKADRSEHVHPLVDPRLPGEAPGREQAVSEQNQRSAGPAGDLDRDLLSAQAASLLST
jgi:hypothetical protein